MAIQTLSLPPDEVICDSCGKHWTGRPESGGVLFGSKAYCPDCTPALEAGIREHGEERFIRGRCPEGRSFADWVAEDLRGGVNETVTYSGDDFKKAFGDMRRRSQGNIVYDDD